MVIAWDDSLATGVAQVDDQHKELIDRVAKLEIALNEGKGDQEIKGIIQFLESYVIKHFHDEETLMTKHNYPGYDAQRQAHQTFIEKFGEMKKDFEADGVTPGLRAKLKINVIVWLVSHINSMDRKLGEFMKTTKP